jgi:hypothetical protein
MASRLFDRASRSSGGKLRRLAPCACEATERAAVTKKRFRMEGTYNNEGRLSALSYGGINESRSYNVRGQMTRLTAAGQVDLEYRFSSTQNNGRITLTMASGETYGYAPDNKRVAKQSGADLDVYFYGATGQRFGTYRCVDDNGTYTSSLVTVSTSAYFAAKLIRTGGHAGDAEQHGQVRHLLPRRHDRPGLRRPALLSQHARTLPDAGPLPGQRRPSRSEQLESLYVYAE